MDLTARAQAELRWWLVRQAEAGVPELVLVALLCEHAEMVAERGYVPRAWRDGVDETVDSRPR